jgi:hypothetical protein
MLSFVAFGQVQVLARRLLRFLDESVEQDHAALFVDVEKDSCNAVLRQARPHFVNTVAERLANWHPDRPAEFHRFDVLPYAFSDPPGKAP